MPSLLPCLLTVKFECFQVKEGYSGGKAWLFRWRGQVFQVMSKYSGGEDGRIFRWLRWQDIQVLKISGYSGDVEIFRW